MVTQVQFPKDVAKRCELQVFNTPCLININCCDEISKHEKKLKKLKKHQFKTWCKRKTI